MTYKEAAKKIEEHLSIHKLVTYYENNELDEAFTIATGVLRSIDQIVWERDLAIQQLEELGYGLGQRIDK